MGEVLCQRDDDQGATELFQAFVYNKYQVKIIFYG